MRNYEIEDLIASIELLLAYVDPDQRDLALEESGMGTILVLLKEGVADATEEKGTDDSVEESAPEVPEADAGDSTPTVE